MTNDHTTGEGSLIANLVRRLLALFVLILFGYLIWLAYTGKYDGQVNRIAAWLHRHFDALRH